MRFRIKKTKHLKSSCVPESRSWVKKRFPASLESRTETGGDWCHLRQGQGGTMALSLPAQGIVTVLSASCWGWQPWQTQDFGVPQWFLKAEAVSSQAVVSLGGNSVQKWLRTHWLGACLRESFSPPINCVQLNILYISYERAFPLQNVSHTDLVRNSSYNPLLLFPFLPLLGFVFVGFRIFFGWRIEKHT